MEPTSPDKYWTVTEKITEDGKRFRIKVKKWFDESDGSFHERILSKEETSC